jgi:hypothetical protein
VLPGAQISRRRRRVRTWSSTQQVQAARSTVSLSWSCTCGRHDGVTTPNGTSLAGRRVVRGLPASHWPRAWQASSTGAAESMACNSSALINVGRNRRICGQAATSRLWKGSPGGRINAPTVPMFASIPSRWTRNAASTSSRAGGSSRASSSERICACTAATAWS